MLRRLLLALVVLTVAALPAMNPAAATRSDATQQSRYVLRSPLHPKILNFVPAPRAKLGQSARTATPARVDSVPTFNGTYSVPNYDGAGNPNSAWTYNMIGHKPGRGGTTTLRAPIIPVVVQLLNADGTVAATEDPRSKISEVLTSPVFYPQHYSSSKTATQYADAISRAEFATSARQDWHTVLRPRVMRTRTMKVPFGSWYFARKADGSVAYMLIDINTFGSLLFPPSPADTSTVIGAAERAGDMTTKDLSTLLFNDVFLDFNNDPTQCCVLGYHSYDAEPGDVRNGNRERDYVGDFSSWISPDIFGSAFVDVTALSHEIAEAFNDPFVTSKPTGAAIAWDTTPWWLAPNGLCQNNLEVGDVIEGLPNATYATTIRGHTYHPQNEALLQWFESKTPSDALHGAYSYPDESVLPTASVPQQVGCL
jgi:hypothetical protein